MTTPAPQTEYPTSPPIDATALQLDHSTLPENLLVAGAPTTAAHEITTFAGLTVGVWEHTPGASRDIEADEVFIVLSGDATVTFDDADSIELGPGSVVRLHAGQRTVWTVRETLRKVYIA